MIKINGKEIKQDHFSAGELKITLGPSNRANNLFEWIYENDAEYFTLAAARHYYSTQPATLILNYCPHARMDRVKNEEDVFTLKTFAYLINILVFDKVQVLDIHSNVAPALIDRCEVVSAKDYIKKAIDTLGYSKDSLCLFFPDEGAQKRYGEMFPEYKQAFGIKKRNWETQKIESYMIVNDNNVIGKEVLIIDDICSYGNTFVKAAEALQTAGAEGINLYITHCEDAIIKGNVFTCGLIDQVFTTNSLVRSEETNNKLIVL